MKNKMRTLKKTMGIFMLFSLIALTACSKKDKNDTKPSEEPLKEFIVGKWQIKSMGEGVTMDDCAKENNFYEFKKDGTAKAEFWMNGEESCVPILTESGKYEIKGSNTIVFTDSEGEVSEAKVERRGNELVFVSDDDPNNLLGDVILSKK